MPALPLDLPIPVYRALLAAVLEILVPFFCEWKAPQQGLRRLLPETNIGKIKYNNLNNMLKCVKFTES